MMYDVFYLLDIAIVNTDPHPSLGVIQEGGVVCTVVVEHGYKVQCWPTDCLLWGFVE